MEKPEQNKLFTPSGCFTGDTLSRYGKGLLSAEEKTLADVHLGQCELCTLALEGFRLSDENAFSEDLEWLNQRFSSDDSGVEMPEIAGNETTESARGFEGPRFPRLSPGEMEEFSRRIKEQAEKQASETSPAIPDQPEPKKKGKTRFLSGKYALIAASLLVLLTVGGIQLYLSQLGKEKNQLQMADQTKPEQDTIEKLLHTPQLSGEEKTAESKASTPPRPEISETVTIEQDIELAIVNDEAATEFTRQPEPEVSINEPIAAAPAGTSKVTETAVEQEETQASVDGVAVISSREAVSRKGSNTKVNVDEEEVAEAEIFSVVEESPQYPGGEDAWQKFLVENFRYPEAAKEASVQGTVYVTFVVEKDGSITEPVVLRGIGAGCDEEALRVIKQMPRWIPGKQRGKPVRVRFNIPVKFTLAG